MSVFAQMYHNYQFIVALLMLLAAAFVVTVGACFIYAWRMLLRLNALEHRQKEISEGQYE
jgi:F0F1-type ATP synthase membrane subunit b/b'